MQIAVPPKKFCTNCIKLKKQLMAKDVLLAGRGARLEHLLHHPDATPENSDAGSISVGRPRTAVSNDLKTLPDIKTGLKTPPNFVKFTSPKIGERLSSETSTIEKGNNSEHLEIIRNLEAKYESLVKESSEEIEKLKREIAGLKLENTKLKENPEVKKKIDTIKTFRMTLDTEKYLKEHENHNSFAKALLACKQDQNFVIDPSNKDYLKLLSHDVAILIRDGVDQMCATHEQFKRRGSQIRVFNLFKVNVAEAIYTTRFGYDSFNVIIEQVKSLLEKYAAVKFDKGKKENEKENEKEKDEEQEKLLSIEEFDKGVLFSQVFTPAAKYYMYRSDQDQENLALEGENGLQHSEVEILSLAVQYASNNYKVFEDEMSKLLTEKSHGNSFKCNVKAFERARWKLCEYVEQKKRPPFDGLMDLMRCRAAFKSFEDLKLAVENLKARFPLIRLKNKLNTNLRNLTINLVYQEIIAEVQLILGDIASELENHQLYEIVRTRSIHEMYQVIKGWGGYEQLSVNDQCKGRLIDDRPLIKSGEDENQQLLCEYNKISYRVLKLAEYGAVDALGNVINKFSTEKFSLDKLYLNFQAEGSDIYVLDISNSLPSDKQIKSSSLEGQKNYIISISGWFSENDGIYCLKFKTQSGRILDIGEPPKDKSKSAHFNVLVPEGYFIVGIECKVSKTNDKNSKPKLLSITPWGSRLKPSLRIGEGNYEGDLNDKKERDGKGVYYESNRRYEGEWKDNMKHGFGKFWIPSSGYCYQGSFEKDKKTGFGKSVKADGEVYIGYRSTDSKEGFGEFLKNDGHRYIGDFHRSKFSYGEVMFPNGDIYEGSFNDDFFDGKGVFYFSGNKNRIIEDWKNFPLFTLKTVKRYEGGFKGDKINGKGTIYFSDGDILVGEFQNNLLHGSGTITHKDGRSLQGEYKEGKLMSGMGISFGIDGRERFEGQFKDGKKDGKVIYILDEYNITYTLDYKNDLVWNGTKVILFPKTTPAPVTQNQIVVPLNLIRWEVTFENGKAVKLKKIFENGETTDIEADTPIVDALDLNKDTIKTYANGRGVHHKLKTDIKAEGKDKKDSALDLEGIYENGLIKQGRGVLNLVAGRYEGDFNGGRPSGSGELKYKDGTIFTGIFKDGNPHKGKKKFRYSTNEGFKYFIVDGEAKDLDNFEGTYTTNMKKNLFGVYFKSNLETQNGIMYFLGDRIQYTGGALRGMPEGDGEVIIKKDDGTVDTARGKYSNGVLRPETSAGLVSRGISIRKDAIVFGEYPAKDKNNFHGIEIYYLNGDIEIVDELWTPEKKENEKDGFYSYRKIGKFKFKKSGAKTFEYEGEYYNEKDFKVPNPKLHNKIRNGKGIEKDGDLVYAGEFKEFIKEGFGKLSKIDGDNEILIYEGEFKENAPSGTGTIYYLHSNVIQIKRHYVGEVKNGKANGKGTLHFSDELSIEGEFLDDYLISKYKITEKNGNTLQGELKNDSEMIYTFVNGDKIIGKFKEDKKYRNPDHVEPPAKIHKALLRLLTLNGKCKMISNGKEFEGIYSSGKIQQNLGVEYFHDGKFRYEGCFVNGKFQGKGKVSFNSTELEGIYENGKIIEGKGVMCVIKDFHLKALKNAISTNTIKHVESEPCYLHYEGEWKNRMREGKIKSSVAGVDKVYEGIYMNDKIQSGEGIELYENGDYYIGEFKEGRRHGSGTYWYSNGSYYKGKFDNSKKHGEGELYNLKGELEVKGVWKEGALVFK